MEKIRMAVVLVLVVLITFVLISLFSGQIVDVSYGIRQGGVLGSIASGLLLTMMLLIVIPLSRRIVQPRQ